jgi:adenylate kinase
MLNIFKKSIAKESEEIINKPKAFIFIGRSGCGKGTQADLLMGHLCKIEDKICKTLRIESGTLLREFAQKEKYTHKKVKEVLLGGVLVPESMIVALWTDYLINNFNGTENLVFDGTPRKIREAQLLDDALHFYDIVRPTVIYMNVSRDWSEKRLQGRARKDDTKEAIERRLAWFETEVMKTIEYYKNNPYYNFIDVNGEQPIEDVHNEILAKLELNR